MNKETLLNKKEFRNEIYKLRKTSLEKIKSSLNKYDLHHTDIEEESRLWNDITKMVAETSAKIDELIWERGTKIVEEAEKEGK